MYTEEHINLLNQFGILSTSLLARKFKWNHLYAKNILLQIARDYENVYFRNEEQIYIEGREPFFWKSKNDLKKMRYQTKKTIRPKKLSKWKDVTKP